MTLSEIDRAVLAVADEEWRKVAMVIARAAEILTPEKSQSDEGLRLIAGRVAELVRDGHLISQGDLSQWRYSEVRLPSAAEQREYWKQKFR
jgi:hypothetical protein